MASSNALTTPGALLPEDIERVIIGGDLARLDPTQRLQYYRAVCDSVGLNPLTRPFEYMTLNGKTVLYAGRSCTDQLRMKHKISVTFVERKEVDGIYTVVARATTPDGRVDESTGVVSLGSLKGDALANAYMRAETKAKRRVTLSICGLSVPDETEVDSIPGAKRVSEAELEKLSTIETKISSNPDLAGDKGPAGPETQPVGPSYKIPFGKFAGKTFSELNPQDLSQYAQALIEDFAQKKKPISGRVAEFLERAEAYLVEVDK